MSVNCPYCGKDDFIPDVVLINIQNYGRKSINFKCTRCHRVVQAQGFRYVEIKNCQKTTNKSDW